MVDGIRTVEKALGKAQKGARAAGARTPTCYARRSVTSKVAIPRGHGHHARDADLQAAGHRHQPAPPGPRGGPRGPRDIPEDTTLTWEMV